MEECIPPDAVDGVESAEVSEEAQDIKETTAVNGASVEIGESRSKRQESKNSPFGAEHAKALPRSTKGREIEVVPVSIQFIQSRYDSNPDTETVEEYVAALEEGITLPRVRVFEEKRTGERYSANGMHRRDAYHKLGRKIPIHVFEVEGAYDMAENESWFANHDNGRSRSRKDKEYQARKAYVQLVQGSDKKPTPAQLARVVKISHSSAAKIIDKIRKEELAGKEAPPASESSADTAQDDSRLYKLLREFQVALEEMSAEKDCMVTTGSVVILNAIERLCQKLCKQQEPL